VERVAQDLDGQKIRLASENQDYGTVRLRLLGRHQAMNAAVAVTAVEEAFSAMGLPTPVAAVKNGLAETEWPGRLQVLGKEPTTILDGGHNPGAAMILAEALKELGGARGVGLICGMCGDKDIAGFLKPLARSVKRLWAVPLRTARGADPARILEAAFALGIPSETASLAEARQAARRWALARGGGVCIAGSLFLAGEVLESHRGGTGEREF